MKNKSGVFVLGMFLLFGAGNGFCADEISELKAQIKTLQATINALSDKVTSLEQKQNAQEEKVERVPELQRDVDELKTKPSGGPLGGPSGLLDNTRVGGHLKLYMFDRSEGKRNGRGQHNNLSGGINNLYLYFTKEISEWLGLDVQTNTEVTASATPKLGSNISRGSVSTSTTIHQAFMTVRLPKEYELKVGIFNPMFSEDYAKETWWSQLYHQNYGLNYLQSSSDSGMELYKSFDLGAWSLPVYLYYLNGNTTARYVGVDNNEGKSVLIHIAPEFFNTSLRLLGSFGYGSWDAGDNYGQYRYAGGVDWKHNKLNILAEYLYTRWNGLSLSNGSRADGTRDGWHMKTIYRFTPKWQGLIDYSHAELYDTASALMRTDTYDEVTFGVDYFLMPSSTIIGQFSLGDASRSDNSEKLQYRRFTIGWRTTF